ncbi:MAG: SulP family inorganic anion transporter, partial [Sedimenticolaceae bacterium]
MSRAGLRADLVAGITVALVLVPQSMAYAQLAGLPVVYGLYASFVPVIIASLWGSSSQLHTGPVAMLSLMSAAALIPFANPGSDMFVELSVMLALMVGILRLTLGVLSLGAVVNLLSSPVIVG